MLYEMGAKQLRERRRPGQQAWYLTGRCRREKGRARRNEPARCDDTNRGWISGVVGRPSISYEAIDNRYD